MTTTPEFDRLSEDGENYSLRKMHESKTPDPAVGAEPEHGSFEWRLQDAQRVLDAPAPKGWVTQVVRRDFLQKLIDIARTSLYAPADDSGKKCICTYDHEKGSWSNDPECPTCAAALASSMSPQPVDADAKGIERAAKWVDTRRANFEAQHGTIDPDTGSLEFGRGAHAEVKSEYAGELAEIAEGLRDLIRCTVPTAGWTCSRVRGHSGPCAASFGKAAALQAPAEAATPVGAGTVTPAQVLAWLDAEDIEVTDKQFERLAATPVQPDQTAQAPSVGATVAWGRCPVCGEDDMRYVRTAEDEPALIHCTNHSCRSNGGDMDTAPSLVQPAGPAVEVATSESDLRLARYEGYKGEPLNPSATDAERAAWEEGRRAQEPRVSTPPAPAAVTEGASEFTPSNECDSPNICRANRGCCGQYGTKAVCAPHPAVAVPERLVVAFKQRNFIVPDTLEEAIKSAANIMCEDGTILAHYKAKLALAVPAGLTEIHKAIDAFEQRERGMAQAHIAAKLVTELRTALAATSTTAPDAKGDAVEGVKP